MSAKPRLHKTSTKFNSMLLLFHFINWYLLECERCSLLSVEANIVLEIQPLSTRTLLHFCTSFHPNSLNHRTSSHMHRLQLSSISCGRSSIVACAWNVSFVCCINSWHTATSFQTLQMPSKHDWRNLLATMHCQEINHCNSPCNWDPDKQGPLGMP